MTGLAVTELAVTELPEVLIEIRGQLGLITLNRPRAINALTHSMIGLISGALQTWRGDDGVATIAIIGAGERGLCAGGDVVGLYRAATGGDADGAASFWRDEYRMNSTIANYPKPVVAVQDGLVLGGGIGVSAHASHRIVTERSRLGFPEVTIGFVPDVGATWLLSHAPRTTGIRLGLTAEHVGAADAIYVGFSDHYVPSDRIPALLSALETADPDDAIAALADDHAVSALRSTAALIDDAFSRETISEIVDALTAAGAGNLADEIRTKSPLAASVTLEAIRRARDLDSLEAALAVEFRVSMNALVAPDFAEGVRAQLIDKDRSPNWHPVSLAAVTWEQVDAFFAPTAAGDLDCPPAETSKETS